MKKKSNKKPAKNIPDAISNNPLNWKGPFYFNKNDSRILLPKPSKSFGWTLNFANPYTYLFLAFSVIVVALLQYVFNLVYALK
ncbi:MAG TPA: DUF5808 domain-containing protein [Bacteroidia bacterium]|jgi:uncharacterized membrane protein|nr:DUF5808 domain-containing protein [Bacteroidia bacterium]